MSQPVFRPAVARDLEPCLAITEQTYAEHRERQPDFFPEDKQKAPVDWLKSLLAGKAGDPFYQNIQATICEIDEKVVGYCVVAFCRLPVGEARHRHEAIIGDISIAPAYQGKGLGRRLLAEVKSGIVATDATSITAQIWHGNTASERVFLAEDFRPAFQEMRLQLASPIEAPCPPLPVSSKNAFLTLMTYSFALFGGLVAFSLLFAAIRNLLLS